MPRVADRLRFQLMITAPTRRELHQGLAPLKAAEDAILLDTTAMSIEQVVDRVLQLASQRFSSSVV